MSMDIEWFLAESIDGPYYQFDIDEHGINGTLRNMDAVKGIWKVTARAVDADLDFDLRMIKNTLKTGMWEAPEAKQWAVKTVMSVVTAQR